MRKFMTLFQNDFDSTLREITVKAATKAEQDREEQRKFDEAYRRIDQLRETVRALERRKEPRVIA